MSFAIQVDGDRRRPGVNVHCMPMSAHKLKGRPTIVMETPHGAALDLVVFLEIDQASVLQQQLAAAVKEARDAEAS